MNEKEKVDPDIENGLPPTALPRKKSHVEPEMEKTGKKKAAAVCISIVAIIIIVASSYSCFSTCNAVIKDVKGSTISTDVATDTDDNDDESENKHCTNCEVEVVESNDEDNQPFTCPGDGHFANPNDY